MAAGTASAGGLVLPGAGAQSTARAGASVAATEDGEAITLNPAGVAKTKGTVITIGLAAIDYFLAFHRNGNYDAVSGESVSYAGTRYPTMENNSSPPLGIPGTGFQPVPVIAITSDLGNRVPGLHAGFGIYAPNAYPFRDFNTVNGKPYFTTNSAGAQDFPATFGAAPPPTRYDVIHQDAAIILPSLVAAYQVLPDLDVGARFSAGVAQLKSTAAVWGMPGNYQENVKQDGLVTIDASDSLVPQFALGANFRPTPNLELAATYTSELDIHAKGTAMSVNGPEVMLGTSQIEIIPVPDGSAQCAKGGTQQKLKACVDLALPQSATLGGRWKFLDKAGKTRGDIELDLDWENWSAQRASDYLVTIDAQVTTPSMPDNGIFLKQNLIKHHLQDTYAARLGGSWSVPAGDNSVVVRGGLSYETAAAPTGWERLDIDGAARTMIAAGASYVLSSWTFDLGAGVILEGVRTDPRTCNPDGSLNNKGCAGTPGYPAGSASQPEPTNQRQGPDPINPIVNPDLQAESPVNEGRMRSHYLLFMLGASYRF